MSLADNVPKYAVLAVLVGGLGAMLWQFVGSGDSGEASVAIRVPELSPTAVQGKVAFDAVCAACHGANAAGTTKGPPLVHDIYNPGHHGDAAFFRAVQLGTPQHHWPYGNMPPQPRVTQEEVAAIVQYVRELQLANGITWREHRM